MKHKYTITIILISALALTQTAWAECRAGYTHAIGPAISHSTASLNKGIDGTSDLVARIRSGSLHIIGDHCLHNGRLSDIRINWSASHGTTTRRDSIEYSYSWGRTETDTQRWNDQVYAIGLTWQW